MSETLAERVAMTQQDLVDLLQTAYDAGATDVHEAWSSGTNHSEPDFAEAASDYARQAVELLAFYRGGATTPARRKTLTAALGLIEVVNRDDAWAERTEETRIRLINLGALFIYGNTNSIRLARVTARCTWHNGEHLLLRWAANARTALAEGNDDNG